VDQLGRDLKGLEQLFDSHDIRRQPAAPGGSDSELAGLLEDVLRRANNLVRLAETLNSFVYAFLSTNSYDEDAVRETSRLELLDTRRRTLSVRLAGWIGSLQSRLPQLMAQRPYLQEHRFYLEDTARQSKFLMSDELEALAAELCVDGGLAFGKLQGNVTSQLKVPFERDGRVEELPITVIRNLSSDPDPDVRRRAYQAEQQGWRSIRTPVAAALNAVKGTAITLAKRRGRSSVLEAALDQNRIERTTLEALLGAIREAFPNFRRYLRAKAQMLGHEQLPWWDLFAPLGGAEKRFSWSQACEFIVEKFGTFADELAAFARRSFDRRWIDAEPREGKRGGGFCMEVLATEESRILLNFDGNFHEVLTLAHELGHAFHNECQRGLPPLRRGAPSTLAETASIFCETLVAQAVLADGTPQEQLMVLEGQLAGATQVCLDISSRFLFESAVIERRAACELTPDELCDLMRQTQAETYGDAIQPDTYHPYMWLWKPHYYAHEYNFYNFPYAFGHLFGLGIYAVYLKEGGSFVPRYKQLLRDTGQEYARPLAARFGIDISQPDFWRGSLKVIEEQVKHFELLAAS
jgi:pepF/M3 family oligoendopeptidase